MCALLRKGFLIFYLLHKKLFVLCAERRKRMSKKGDGLPHRRARRFAMTFLGKCGGQSAAAHMGAALREHIKGYGGTGRRGRRPLQRNLQNMRRGGRLCPPVSPFSSAWAGGVEPRPYAGNKMISIKMSFRGAQRRGNPFSHVSGVRRGGITDCHTSVRAGSQ